MHTMKVFAAALGYWVVAPFSLGTATAQQPRPIKVLFIIADGISADVLERTHTPRLDEIIRTGVYRLYAHVGGDRGTYSETPHYIRSRLQ